MDETSPSSRSIVRKATSLTATLVGHGLGVAGVFVAIFVVLAGTDRVTRLIEVFGVPGFASQALPSVAIHLGVAAVIWAVLYGIGRRLLARDDQNRRLVRLGRGTVMVETLIVFPILMMLILGLAQLAINSAASVLSQLATYESARTVWLWHPERDRFDIEEEDIAHKGRIQAAAVLTPVALSYGTDKYNTPNQGTPEERFSQLRGAFVAGQFGWTGETGRDRAADVSLQAEEAYGEAMEVHSLTGALDGTDYAARSALKFNGAYATTEVEVIEDDDNDEDEHRIGARLQYHHYQNIPWVGRFFGDHSEDGQADSDRPGNYSTYTNAFTLPSQPTPHPEMP